MSANDKMEPRSTTSNAAMQRLGFRDEADAEQPLLVSIEDLLRLCIENRDRISFAHEPTIVQAIVSFLLHSPLK
jgi:hypothetical protein